MPKFIQILSRVSILFFITLFSISLTTITTEAATKTKVTYRFSPSADKCYASGTKEYKKLSKNRIYKTLADCQKKLKNKSAVLGAFEKKGGASTSVSLEIK
jgi:hypothetical protein